MQRNRGSTWTLQVCLVFLGILQVGAVLVALERPAQAYVDPGSGYVLLQVLGSMAVGAIYYLRHKLNRLLGRIRGKEEPEAAPETEAIPNVPSIPPPPKANR